MATAGDVITLAKTMNAMDNEELGNDTQQTQSYLLFINRALKELAHLAYRTRVSDPLTITEDGFQTFKRNNTDITDMYSPLRILDSNGRLVNKRSSFDIGTGWWRESDAQAIHTKGLSGDYTLHYVGYPAAVTETNSVLDFPEAGIMGLTFWVIGIAKESRNAFDESEAMYARARERFKVLVLANQAARGVTPSGYVPSIEDVDRGFKF